MNYKYNSGVFTEDEAIRIQEALFRMGWEWGGVHKGHTAHLSMYIFIYENDGCVKYLRQTDDKEHYEKHVNTKLSHVKLGWVLDGRTPDGRERYDR